MGIGVLGRPSTRGTNSPQIPASLNSYDAISRDHDSGIAGQGGIERGKARRPVDHGSRDDADSKALRDLSPQIINRQHAIATRGGQRPPRSFWPSPSCGPDCSETHSSMIVVVSEQSEGTLAIFSRPTATCWHGELPKSMYLPAYSIYFISYYLICCPDVKPRIVVRWDSGCHLGLVDSVASAG